MKHLAAALFLTLTACGGEPEIAQQDTPPLYKYASLKTALAEAKETRDVFWERFAAPAPGEEEFRVKITVTTEDYVTDYVWVVDLEEAATPGNWLGNVGAENGGNNRFQTGDTIKFNESDVADWAYHDNGKIRGGYTTRAMLTLPKDVDISAIKDKYHDSPVP